MHRGDLARRGLRAGERAAGLRGTAAAAAAAAAGLRGCSRCGLRTGVRALARIARLLRGPAGLASSERSRATSATLGPRLAVSRGAGAGWLQSS
jgi:hypothetical protein